MIKKKIGLKKSEVELNDRIEKMLEYCSENEEKWEMLISKLNLHDRFKAYIGDLESQIAAAAMSGLLENKINANTGEMTIPIFQRSQPSVEISRSGKGEISFKVKSYRDEMEDALETAINAAAQLISRLEE